VLLRRGEALKVPRRSRQEWKSPRPISRQAHACCLGTERRRVLRPTVLVFAGVGRWIGRTSRWSIRVIFARQDYMLVTYAGPPWGPLRCALMWVCQPRESGVGGRKGAGAT
jgi:hypothetical protein